MTRPDQSNRRYAVLNTQLTYQEVLSALEDYVVSAKDSAAALVSYAGRLPASPEQQHVLREARSIQGSLGGVVLQLVRALSDDKPGVPTS